MATLLKTCNPDLRAVGRSYCAAREQANRGAVMPHIVVDVVDGLNILKCANGLDTIFVITRVEREAYRSDLVVVDDRIRAGDKAVRHVSHDTVVDERNRIDRFPTYSAVGRAVENASGHARPSVVGRFVPPIDDDHVVRGRAPVKPSVRPDI